MNTQEYRRRRFLAHKLLQSLRRGKRPCVLCGLAKAERHHTDYRKPYSVVWLCRAHHKLQHDHYGSGMQMLGNPVVNENGVNAGVSSVDIREYVEKPEPTYVPVTENKPDPVVSVLSDVQQLTLEDKLRAIGDR